MDLEDMGCFPLLVARLYCFKFKYANDCKSNKMSLSICKCLEKSNPAFVNTGNLKSHYLITSLAERVENRIASQNFTKFYSSLRI